MIQEAFISGPIGQVIYTEDDRWFLLTTENLEQPTECHPIDASTFFGFGAEVKALSNEQLSLTNIKSQLIDVQQAHYALRLLISGMDRALSYDSRAAAITTLESLIKKQFIYDFVRARILSRPIPEEADIEIALDIAINSNANAVGILYQSSIDWDRAIRLVHETWLKAANEYSFTHQEQSESEILLTDLGVFAEMAAALAANNLKLLSSVVVTYGQKPELNKALNQGVFILNDLRTKLARTWFAKSSQLKTRKTVNREFDETLDDKDPVHEIVAGFRNRRGKPRSREFSADEAKEKVDHQIESISKLILQGNIGRANRYLKDLIDFHIEHSKREHLGMSLCSLAKVAIDVHSFELAERLVAYALLLGIEDVVISNTQAHMHKSMGDLEKALGIYEQTMSRFPNEEVTRNGYADVLKSMGDFDKALAIYTETIERFPNNEFAWSGYADVLKSMGDLDRALAVYEQAMSRFPNDEVTRNGYAEVLKSMGDLDEALGVYEQTIESFPNNAVARNGYAEVLKSMGDFDKALAIYKQTIERFPNNEFAWSGYAEVWKSMGDFDKALLIYEQAMERFPNNRVIRNGYAGILLLKNRIEEARSLLSISNPFTRADWVDFHVLAMSYIRSGDLEEAIQRLTYGLERCREFAQKGYFATALGFARIRKRQFAEALDILPTNISNLDLNQKQTRLALVGHSQAALGRKDEAFKTLTELERATNPRMMDLKEALLRRYKVGRESDANLSPTETSALDERIYEQEFLLAA